MLATAALVAFVPALDLERARSFYEHTLGLPLVEANPMACVFTCGGATLRVTAVSALTPAGFTIAGWVVPDIAAEVADMTARGVAFQRYDGLRQDALGVWTTPGGDQVAWFRDPDGNTLSLSQHRRG